tara:strand:- start:204405 stop:204995 length:591 start_codon:yes stop_codon:yes gene_type:complete
MTITKNLTSAALLLCFSTLCQAAFYNETLSSVKTHQADAETRSQLMSALESCGVPNDGIEASCVIQSLQGPNNNIKNPNMAANIVNSYKAALNNKVSDPKCQLPDIYAVNQIAADCVLVLHYSVLESGNPSTAKQAFDRCLQGKIGGLALAGNLAAQFSMKKISEESGRGDQMQVWANVLKENTDPNEVKDMASCF